jgi:hypothetical protein
MTCVIEGCEKPGHKGARHCGMHATRIQRHGNPHHNERDGTARTKHSSGYIVVRRPGHPVATRGPLVFEHRAALYDVIGPGGHACHWCGNIVAWLAKGPRMLVVDHLDSDKTNNATDNLVASCNPCNVRRGQANKKKVVQAPEPKSLPLTGNTHPDAIERSLPASR